ncbi:MAG: cbb3-type cytochrome c oxidase subunit I [Dehalococcoidales bacterium]|nr:cbb3-type cytochrome c oxidase subunit I [Dehalococcoidales bacterium]
MQVEATDKRLVKFIVASVLYFAWNVIQGAVQAQAAPHEFISQGPAGIIVGAHVHVGTLGWISLALAALIYYLVPRITNKPITAPGLINWLFWVFVVAFTINSILMITVGIRAGNAFLAGVAGPQLGAIMDPYMMAIGILSIICGLIWLIFAGQILVSIARKAS